MDIQSHTDERGGPGVEIPLPHFVAKSRDTDSVPSTGNLSETEDACVIRQAAPDTDDLDSSVGDGELRIGAQDLSTNLPADLCLSGGDGAKDRRSDEAPGHPHTPVPPHLELVILLLLTNPRPKAL